MASSVSLEDAGFSITIKSWMCEAAPNGLGLAGTGFPLALFVVIYAASTNGVDGWRLSVSQTASLLNTSTETVRRSLRYLLDMGLICQSTELLVDCQRGGSPARGYKANMGKVEEVLARRVGREPRWSDFAGEVVEECVETL